MLEVFSQLNGAPATFQQQDLEDHFNHSDHLRDVQFWPPEWPSTLSKVEGKTFKNVSLAKTKFTRITFTKCKFEDCLFTGAEFDEVEFHRCEFINCYFYKSGFRNCYLDPNTIEIDKRYKKTHANVFVTLFQRLLDDSRDQNQAEFAEAADIKFRQWKRAQLGYERKRGYITGLQYHWKRCTSIINEFATGFGYRPWRFYSCTLALFLLFAFANWVFLSSSLVSSATDAQIVSLVDAVYYTFSIMTILGFSSITPETPAAKLATVGQALVAVGWLSLLTALLVKRFIR